LVRAANTGISAAFDAYGRELGRLGLNRAGVVSVGLPGPLVTPVYARFGLLIPLCLGLLATILGLVPRTKA